jgi:itaconate CoA-transferase
MISGKSSLQDGKAKVVTPESAPLSGSRVVAIEHSVAAPLCTRLLAELGAEVVKVERENGGDFARHWDGNAVGDSAQFWWLNRGKLSVRLNLSTPEGRASLAELLSSADVLVCNMSPLAADRLGLTDPAFETRYPGLVFCQISGYGNTASSHRDRKAYDMLIQAESGIMSVTGTPETPCRVGVSICDVSTGLYAAVLILAALQQRARTGRGARLDVGMMDVAVEFLAPMLISYLNAGVVYPRLASSHHAVAPYGVFTCSDSAQIVLAVESEPEWHAFCADVLENEALADDARFVSNSARVENLDELTQIVQGKISTMDAAQAVESFARAGLAYAALNDIQGLAEHPVLSARGMVASVPNLAGEPVQALVSLIERSFPGARTASRPPRLGEHDASLLAPAAVTPSL